jgi:hypothetical protein
MMCLRASRPVLEQYELRRDTSAEANSQNARLEREVAQVAVREYVDGEAAGQQMELEGEISIAQAELDLARDELHSARAQKIHSALSLRRLELAELRARFGLEKAQHRRRVLLEFTKARKIKELQSVVERAHSDELARQATWELEKAQEEKLKHQVEVCTILAPIDGVLQYVPGPVNVVDPNFGEIKYGSNVRERQLMFRILTGDQPR